MSERLQILGLALCLSACGNGGGDGDAGVDGGARLDAGPRPDTAVDVGPLPDAFSTDDAYVAPGTDAGASDTGQWVMGYYAAYQIDMYPVDQIDWSGLTHIALAPMVVKADGTIDYRFSAFGTDAEGRTFAQSLSSAAHAHGVHPILMLGGAGLSDHVLPAMNADMAGFVTRLLGVMDELGYDGIDLDVEATGFAVPELTRLASALRAARPSILLSLPGAVVEYGTHPEAGLATLVGYLDRYFIQSYYGGSDGLFTGSGPTGGFQSWFGSAMSDANDQRPFAIDHSFDELVAAGVPAEKLGMGVAFYAACYLIPNTTPPGGSDVSGPRQPAYASSSYCWDCGIGGGDNDYPLSAFFAAGGTYDHAAASARMFDTVAGSSYLSLPTATMDSHCGGRTRYVVYETPQSLEARGVWSRAHGYGGIIVWTIQQGWLPAGAADGMERNALMQALRRGFIAPP
jgi:chitinase